MCFGPLDCSTKLEAKWAKLVQLMQMFAPRRGVGVFRNECTRSTPLDANHMFWCILYSLGAFGTIFFPYETRFKMSRTGAINARIHAMKIMLESFATNAPDPTALDPKLIFWSVSYSLGAFGTILLPYETHFKTGRTGAINAKVRAIKSCRNFSQWTHPIDHIRP
jgi:hypothetical protein